MFFSFSKKKRKYNKEVNKKSLLYKKKKNPYFTHKKHFNWEKFLNYFLIILLLIWLSFIVYFVFFSSFFEIKNIKLTIDGEVLDQYELENKIYSYLQENNDNFFLFDIHQFANELKSTNPFVQDVKVVKKIKNSLDIYIKEKDYPFIWQNKNLLYAVAKDGKIIDVLNKEKPLLLLNKEKFDDKTYLGSILLNLYSDKVYVKDPKNEVYKEGDYLEIAKEKLDKILYIYHNLPLFKNLNIVNISFADNLYQNLVLYTLDNYIIYFNLNSDLEDLKKQLARLYIFLNNSKKSFSLKNLEYIDLRISEKVFYKLRK